MDCPLCCESLDRSVVVPLCRMGPKALGRVFHSPFVRWFALLCLAYHSSIADLLCARPTPGRWHCSVAWYRLAAFRSPRPHNSHTLSTEGIDTAPHDVLARHRLPRQHTQPLHTAAHLTTPHHTLPLTHHPLVPHTPPPTQHRGQLLPLQMRLPGLPLLLPETQGEGRRVRRRKVPRLPPAVRRREGPRPVQPPRVRNRCWVCGGGWVALE